MFDQAISLTQETRTVKKYLTSCASSSVSDQNPLLSASPMGEVLVEVSKVLLYATLGGKNSFPRFTRLISSPVTVFSVPWRLGAISMLLTFELTGREDVEGSVSLLELCLLIGLFPSLLNRIRKPVLPLILQTALARSHLEHEIRLGPISPWILSALTFYRL